MTATLTAPPPPATTPPARLTADDFDRMGSDGKGYELIDGELVEQAVSYLSSYVSGEVHRLLANHVKPRGLGWVAPEGTAFRCLPDSPNTVRKADTAFHRLDRLTAEQATRRGFCPVVPDLVVEVVSPDDRAYEVDDKRAEWLTAGARLVWVIYPDTRTVHAYAADGTVRLFGPADELTAAPVLPDFRTPVADLFTLPAAVS